MAVAELLALLGGTPSTHNEEFYYFNCPHSFRTTNKLESHMKEKRFL